MNLRSENMYCTFDHVKLYFFLLIQLRNKKCLCGPSVVFVIFCVCLKKH